MKAPESLETLVEYGIVQEVVRPLMSGKEAQIYVVVSGGETCVAKVYKEATHRNFKHRSDYTEGRRTRNTRDQRAMAKRTTHGKKKDEDAWRSTEVDMLYRLRDAGVRVPEPLNFVEGVFVMELVLGKDGEAAPRLGDLEFTPSEAKEIYDRLIQDVVRMLCAGVVHGDLSDFNVLMSHDGPVIIDFPQSVDPTQNPNSEKLLLRDVANLHRFLSRFAPDVVIRPYAEEIWNLYKTNKLTPETKLKGTYQVAEGKVDTKEVMALIDDANRDEAKRQAGYDREEVDTLDGVVPEAIGGSAPLRRVVDFTQERAAEKRKAGPSGGVRKSRSLASEGTTQARRKRGRGRGAASEQPTAGRKSPIAAKPPTGPASSRAGATEDSPPLARRNARKRRTGVGTSRTAAMDSAEQPRGRAASAVSQEKMSGTRESSEAPKRARSRRSRGRRSGRGRSDDAAAADSGRGEKKPPARSQANSGEDTRRPNRSASKESSRGSGKPSSRGRHKTGERAGASAKGNASDSPASSSTSYLAPASKDPRPARGKGGDRAPGRRRRSRRTSSTS